MTLTKIEELVKKWLVFSDDLLIISVLATVLGNRFEGAPLWLMLIAPPSSGKTEILYLPRKLEDTYLLADLTPRTFFSGFKTAEQQNYGLLPKLLGKTVINKDFTIVLSMPQEKRAEILGQLRDIYDGESSKHFGSKTAPDVFKGKMGLLCACTPAIDLHHRANAILGERFVYVRHELSTDELRSASAERAVRTDAEHDTLVERAQDAVVEYMKGLPACDPKIPDRITDKLITLAEAVAWGRCPVPRDGYSRMILQLPNPEGPGRVVKQLATVARAHAALYHRKQVEDKDLVLVRRIAEDTIPPLRKRLLQVFASFGGEGAEVKHVAEKIKLPYATVREHAEDALVVGLLEEVEERKRLSERGRTLLAVFRKERK